MKVLLVANYGPDRQKSMARYAAFLSAELAKRGYAVEVIRPAPIAVKLVDGDHRLFHWLAYLDKFVFFPPQLWFRALDADLVHVCDHSNSFYLRWTGRAPNLITAHDAIAIRSALGHFPQYPTRSSGKKFQRWILSGLARARTMVCVSEKTREDFAALLPGGPQMTVIPHPAACEFRPARAEDVASIRAAYGLGDADEYLLHVGKNSWYKNRSGALRIFAELRKLPRFHNVKMMLAGDPMPNKSHGMDGVIECGAPSDEQLRVLYTGALALLFPSLQEGFGWPIIEAQACGCPVITSARPPMTEVAGDAAIFIDPEDEPGAAATIAARIHEVDELKRAGLAHVQSYSSADAIARYCEVYRQILAASPAQAQQRGGTLVS